jgi:HPt (histidine-containing phosphotransfer) domain-containing protein
VHALKGSARSIGAIALAQNASEIHESSKSISLLQITNNYTLLEICFSDTKDALLNYLEQLKSAAL